MAKIVYTKCYVNPSRILKVYVVDKFCFEVKYQTMHFVLMTKIVHPISEVNLFIRANGRVSLSAFFVQEWIIFVQVSCGQPGDAITLALTLLVQN